MLINIAYRLTGALLWTALFAAPVSAEDYLPVKFTLMNSSGVPMTHFYMSPPSTNDWEEDVLGVDVLGDGESVQITVSDGRPDCTYDFKAKFSDDTEVVSSGTACDGETYVVHAQ